MPIKDPFKAFTSTFKHQRSVTEPIASDILTFKDSKGREHNARLEVGRPQQVPGAKNGDWSCPVFIEGWTEHVVPVMGVGSVDSLMNAITLVRSFHEQVAWFQISYGSSKPRSSGDSLTRITGRSPRWVKKRPARP